MNPRLRQFADSFSREDTLKFHEHFLQYTDYFEYQDALTEADYALIYLAWLWAHGWVYNREGTDYYFLESETDMTMKEVALEVELLGVGYGETDLLCMYVIYELDVLRDEMGWNQPHHHPCPVKNISALLHANPGGGCSDASAAEN